ncbi:MAG: MerC domain-containing protein [Pseudomonadota bacterium]
MFAAGIADRTAVATSALCVVHCLAAPIASVLLPIGGAVFAAEGVHVALASVAMAMVVTVAVFAPRGRSPAFLIPALLGCAFLVAGLEHERIGIDERLATVIGGVLLATAHVRRLLNHQRV